MVAFRALKRRSQVEFDRRKADVQCRPRSVQGGTQLTYGNLTANTWYTFRYTANMATAGSISGNATFYPAVPEPATWGMMLLGFAGMGLAMRRRRRPALAQIA